MGTGPPRQRPEPCASPVTPPCLEVLQNDLREPEHLARSGHGQQPAHDLRLLRRLACRIRGALQLRSPPGPSTVRSQQAAGCQALHALHSRPCTDQRSPDAAPRCWACDVPANSSCPFRSSSTPDPPTRTCRGHQFIEHSVHLTDLQALGALGARRLLTVTRKQVLRSRFSGRQRQLSRAVFVPATPGTLCASASSWQARSTSRRARHTPPLPCAPPA